MAKWMSKDIQFSQTASYLFTLKIIMNFLIFYGRKTSHINKPQQQDHRNQCIFSKCLAELSSCRVADSHMNHQHMTWLFPSELQFDHFLLEFFNHAFHKQDNLLFVSLSVFLDSLEILLGALWELSKERHKLLFFGFSFFTLTDEDIVEFLDLLVELSRDLRLHLLSLLDLVAQFVL